MEPTREITARLRPCLVLLAWIAATAWLIASGTYTKFLAPGFWVLLVCAVAAMTVFAIARISRRPDDDEPPATASAILRGAFLLLPLAFLVFLPTPEADSYAFDKRGGLGMGRSVTVLTDDESQATTQSDADGQRPRVPGPAMKVTLLDIYNSFDSLARQRVSTIGMVNPREGLPDDMIVVFRFTISCCAADAQPVPVLVTCKGARSLPRDTWVRVEGVLGSSRVGMQTLPMIKATRIEKISAPYDRYLR